MTNSEMNTSEIKSLVKLYDDLYNEKDVIKFDKELLKDEKKIRISEINIKIKETKKNLKEISKTCEPFERAYINENLKIRKNINHCEKMKKYDNVERKIFSKLNPAYIYILPAAIGSLFFVIVPFIFMMVVSFFKFSFADPLNSKFVGFNNFITVFTKDRDFKYAFTNTILFAFFTVFILMIITVSLAAWLSKNTKINNITQTMIFTPHIASLVSVSILWLTMLNPTGIVNQVLSIFGIKGPNWLTDPNTALISVGIAAVWKSIGYYVLIIISGLQSIPTYVYEAAKLDKASKWTTFRKITLPLLSPTLMFVFTVKFINAFKTFVTVDLMTQGGPQGHSMVLGYWIYTMGRVNQNYGFAMVGAIVLTILIAIVTFVNNKLFNKKVTYQ